MFDHEKLDVYRVGLEFVQWVYDHCAGLSGIARFPRDQLFRSSQSIIQNIAEGNGKRSGPERRRYLEIARGSAMESASSLDILAIIKVVDMIAIEKGKTLLERIVRMLSKMTDSDNCIREDDKNYE
jgi:four helix bundle protein